MRGTKAKALRKLAGCNPKNPDTRYAEVESTKRTVGIPKMDNGSVVLDVLTGKPLLIGSFVSSTLVLKDCSRKIYQVLKNQYSQFVGGTLMPRGR
jgi:hypothetical protein